MPISFTCKSCGRPIRVKDSLAGRMARCPDCGNRVRIPDDREPLAESEPAADDERYADYDDDYDEFGDDHSAYTTAPRSSRSSRDDRNPYSTRNYDEHQCPACGERISRTDKRCRFCGERLRSRTRDSAAVHRGNSGGGMSVGDWIVALICPGIGCILAVIYLLTGQSKGLVMLGVSLLASFGWALVRVAILNLNGGF